MLNRKDIERRLRMTGAESLTEHELLFLCGITVSNPDPMQLLDSSFSSLLGEGLRISQAYRISSVAELARRMQMRSMGTPRMIHSSSAAFKLLSPIMSRLDHEECWTVYLSQAGGVLSTFRLSSGGISGTVIDARMVAREACNRGASSVILAHNHPSLNPLPSTADINNTQRLRDTLSVLDIQLLDHIIVAGDRYYSFAEENVF